MDITLVPKVPSSRACSTYLPAHHYQCGKVPYLGGDVLIIGRYLPG